MALDRGRHARSLVHYGVEDPQAAVATLAAHGVAAEAGSTGPPGDPWRFITIRPRDVRKVETLLGRVYTALDGERHE